MDKRASADGEQYTKAEFLDFYGGIPPSLLPTYLQTECGMCSMNEVGCILLLTLLYA